MSPSSQESPTAIALDGDWQRLPGIVRRLHGECVATGSFTIERGAGWVAAILCRMSGLPRRGTDVPTRLEVTSASDGLIWTRRFGTDRLVTRQRALGPGVVAERLGMIECAFEPDVTSNGIEYRQCKAWLCLGRWRLLLPRLLRPRIEARAWTRDPERDGVMEVDVILHAPLGGKLLRYRGSVREAIE